MTNDFAQLSQGSFGRLGPGRRIAGYLIEEQVGAGGMAVVFRARDESLGRPAALKVIASAMADDNEFRARFLRESRAAAAVDSPHIVPVYSAGEAEGLLYIATRFVDGGDLADLMRRSGGRLAADRAAHFVSQIAAALDAAHAAGLVHRDVKPANVLVDAAPGRPEHAYLSDFGLSKGMHSTGLTASGQFLGTPGYSAPEQIRGDQLDGRADQYALGCVAFALLAGTHPFRRDSAVATLFAHLRDPVPPVTGLRPELPPAVDRVLGRALAKSPADRYGGCGEFAAALRDALLPPRTQPPQPTQAADVPPPRPASAPDRRRRGKVRAIWAAGAAAVLAAGVLTAVLLPGSSGKPGAPGATRSGAASGPAASQAAVHPATSAAASPAATPTSGNIVAVRVLADDKAGGKYGLSQPAEVADDGTHIWVSSSFTNTVTELSASDGAFIRKLAGGSYGFNSPDTIAADSAHVWVTNGGDNSVTELSASDGAFVRKLAGGSYGFNFPFGAGVADDGSHVWVVNTGSNSVTELAASDGAFIRYLAGGSYGFSSPFGIALAGGHVWVSNGGGQNSVTELNASDGSWIRTVAGGSNVTGIGSDGSHVWVINDNTGVLDSLTELSASDGSRIRTLAGFSTYGFNNSLAIAFDGRDIWVSNPEGGSVTELDASDSKWIRTLKGRKYGLNAPAGIAVNGTHVFIVDDAGNSVTELTVG
jgi:serine/threonine-protein kinase